MKDETTEQIAYRFYPSLDLYGETKRSYLATNILRYAKHYHIKHLRSALIACFSEMNREQITMLELAQFDELADELLQDLSTSEKETVSDIYNDLCKESEEVICSHIRFNGVSMEKINSIFKKHGLEKSDEF